MSTKARHPAVEKGCTEVQIGAFERIAIGDDQGHAPATLAALERRGLITLHETLVPGEFAVRLKIPVVPSQNTTRGALGVLSSPTRTEATQHPFCHSANNP